VVASGSGSLQFNPPQPVQDLFKEVTPGLPAIEVPNQFHPSRPGVDEDEAEPTVFHQGRAQFADLGRGPGLSGLLHGTPGVDDSTPLREKVSLANAVGRGHEDLAQRRGRQRRFDLQHLSGHGGDDGGGKRGPIDVLVVGRDDLVTLQTSFDEAAQGLEREVRQVCREVGFRNGAGQQVAEFHPLRRGQPMEVLHPAFLDRTRQERSGDPGGGSDHLRLDDKVEQDPEAVAVEFDFFRAAGLARDAPSHSQHGRSIGGGPGQPPVIPRRGHHQDPVAHGRLGGLGDLRIQERAVPVAADRDVENPNPQTLAMGPDPLQSPHDQLIRDAPLAADLDQHHPGPAGQAAITALREGAIAGRHHRGLHAVPVPGIPALHRVQTGRLPAGIVEGRHSPFQVGMGEKSGVQKGDGDSSADRSRVGVQAPAC